MLGKSAADSQDASSEFQFPNEFEPQVHCSPGPCLTFNCVHVHVIRKFRATQFLADQARD